MKFKFLKAAIASLVLLNSSLTSATLIESINNLNPGDKYRVLFVTSTQWEATSSSIADYNDRVTQAANAVGSITDSLALNWKALASAMDVNVQVNTQIYNNDNAKVTFFNTNGDIVALSGVDLWDGNLATPIGFNEFITQPSTDKVFTGTDRHGYSFNPLGGNVVTFGLSGNSDKNWRIVDYIQPWKLLRFYGVSEIVTTALVDVPEPSSFILLSLGIAVLFMSRHIKQS